MIYDLEAHLSAFHMIYVLMMYVQKNGSYGYVLTKYTG